MKIGFSTLSCPGWDLATVLANASSMGFQGVELRGLRGELHLPLVPELAGKPDKTKELFAEKKVELVCLACSATLDSKKPREVARQKAILTEFIELAGRLECPYVRILPGEIQKWDNPREALARIAGHVSSLVPILSRWGVTLLVENGGDFPGSADLWFVVDAVEHPAVRCCWNQCYAMSDGERPTTSIPRLGNKIGLVHVCDAQFDSNGVLLQYTQLGEGQCEVSRQIDLLKGQIYDRYVMFEWPKMWVPNLDEPEAALPAAAKYLTDCINAKQAILSAYKGDRNAPKFTRRDAAAEPAAG